MDTGADRPIIPRYLTYEDAATYLSTTVQALYKKVQLGQLPVIRDGRWVRFDRFDLDAYLHARREEAWS